MPIDDFTNADDSFFQQELNPRSQAATARASRDPRLRSAFTGGGGGPTGSLFSGDGEEPTPFDLGSVFGLSAEDQEAALNPQFTLRPTDFFNESGSRDFQLSEQEALDFRSQLQSKADQEAEFRKSPEFIQANFAGQDTEKLFDKRIGGRLSQRDRKILRDPTFARAQGLSNEQAMFRALSQVNPEVLSTLDFNSPEVASGLVNLGRQPQGPGILSDLGRGKSNQKFRQFIRGTGEKKGGGFTGLVGNALKYGLPAIASAMFGGVLGPALGAAAGVQGATVGTAGVAGSASVGTGIGGALTGAGVKGLVSTGINSLASGEFNPVDAAKNIGGSLLFAGAKSGLGSIFGKTGAAAGGLAGGATKFLDSELGRIVGAGGIGIARGFANDVFGETKQPKFVSTKQSQSKGVGADSSKGVPNGPRVPRFDPTGRQAGLI
jgi:hypothetical protein